MLSNIKATIRRYFELSWSDLTNFKSWLQRSAAFNSFDPESLASPSLRIAVATNGQNQPIAYCPVEQILMVSAYAVNPNATAIEAQRGGDCLDAEIARHAQMHGISKLLIVVPENYDGLPKSELKTMRFYERTVPQTVSAYGVDCLTPSHATQYQN